MQNHASPYVCPQGAHTTLAPFPFPTATTTTAVTIANTIATRGITGITGITRTTATHVKVAAKKKNITKEKKRAQKNGKHRKGKPVWKNTTKNNNTKNAECKKGECKKQNKQTNKQIYKPYTKSSVTSVRTTASPRD